MSKALKIEDIKEQEWYWDNYDKIYFQVIQIRTIKKQIPETIFEKEHTEVIHKITRIYHKNPKYGEDLTYLEDRFFKYKEDVEND